MHKLLLLLITAALATAFGADAALFFIQMSDPQFGMYEQDKGFARETENFEAAISAANKLKPAFVVVTGDLVNRAGDTAQIAEYKRIAGKLDSKIRLYSVPGNHDVGNEPTPASLAAWREAFGPDYYVFRAGELHAIVLNSVLMGKRETSAAETAKQDEWLEAELKKRGGAKHLIIFLHHPLFLKDPNEADQYFNI